ncbi:MAG: hypothetical protein WA003_15825 [Desulfuromonadaceae bacterium]
MSGTVRVTTDPGGPVRARRVVFEWVGDSGDGSVPDIEEVSLCGKITRVATIPGTGAPPTSYNLYILDADGIDTMDGEGAARSATAVGDITFNPPVQIENGITHVITGQTNAGATGKTVVYLEDN